MLWRPMHDSRRRSGWNSESKIAIQMLLPSFLPFGGGEPESMVLITKRSGTGADGDVHDASSNELRWDPCLLGKSRSQRAVHVPGCPL